MQETNGTRCHHFIRVKNRYKCHPIRGEFCKFVETKEITFLLQIKKNIIYMILDMNSS